MAPIMQRVRDVLSRPEQTQISLGVVAIIVFVFGWWQLRTAIRLPFAPLLPLVAPTELVGGQAAADNSRNIDTDGDGLSDYDEQNLYRTSIYLKDTDSDGFDDKTEVTSGNDPTCPKGESCLRSAPVTGTSSQIVPEQGSLPSVSEIRQLLQQNGITDDVLAQYDDATLLQLYQEVASESLSGTANGAAPSAGSAGTSNETANQLTQEQKNAINQMTPAQLRELLKQGGADASLLNQIDDATLQAIIKQQLGN